MAYWLVKSEPETWSWDAHAKAGDDAWTGVRNHQAKAHEKAMKTGDKVFYYHSGDQKAVVGISTVTREAYPDPTDASGMFVAVNLKADKPLKQPVTLDDVKADKRLANMALIKFSRLSVQPVTAEEWKLVCKMGGM